MGWDIDRFPEGEVNLELICCICTCILEDPVESPCRHVFCSQCIKTWLSNQKSCPHCRAAVHKRDLQSVVPLLKNIISKQRIFCDNKERGCDEIVPLENLQTHVSICNYGLVACPNDGCNAKIMRKDLKSHSEICLKRTVLCEEGCEMFLKLGERGTHNCVQALRAHFQEVQNEMLSRLAKLEELVNVLVSKNNQTRRTRRTSISDTYNCAPYSIPSPQGYESRPPPYTVFAGMHEVNSTINLTGYSLEQHDLSDSIESIDSENGDTGRSNELTPRHQVRVDSPVDREMSPVYDHLDRTNLVNDDRRHEVPRRPRQRSRSPHSRSRVLDLTYSRNNRISGSSNRSLERDNRVERSNRTFDYRERQSSRREGTEQDDSLVLRIGVSQTVSDSSSSSSSSSGSDTD